MVYDKLVEKAVFHVATSSDVGNRAGGKRPHVWFAPLIVGHIIIMSEEKSLQNDTVIGEPVLLSLRLRLNVSRSISVRRCHCFSSLGSGGLYSRLYR